MMKYKKFIFKDCRFNIDLRKLDLFYSLDNALNFKESYQFEFEFADYDKLQLDRAVQTLFFMAGVSYYKTFMPPEISVEAGELDSTMSDFFNKTYQRGLGEFFYLNNLDPKTPVVIPPNIKQMPNLESSSSNKGVLVAIGGGKDSLVTVESLRDKVDGLATWSVSHHKQLDPLVKKIGLPHYWVNRTWDHQLLDLNKNGALNGHVPISAILACVGTIVALLTGRKAVVMSNEQSANESTLTYREVEINHQYSKSLEFELDYQSYLKHVSSSTLYYSYLRPLSELRIAEIFAKGGFEKYKDVFSSCNRAFTHDSDHIFWDGKCPKCAFIFLALTPFVERPKLEKLFNRKNLLLDPGLDLTYKQLLGIEGDKPLDCVGEIRESREAMELAKQTYPDLNKYKYEIPADYDYKSIETSSMPDEIFQILQEFLAQY